MSHHRRGGGAGGGDPSQVISYDPSDTGHLSQDSRSKYDHFIRHLFKYREGTPPAIRPKLADYQLRDLARSLLDDTVFEIVQELEDIQTLRERQLLNRRMKVVGQHKTRKLEMAKRQKEELARAKPHQVPLLRAEQERKRAALDSELAEEVRKTDREVILELDQLVSNQQSTLCQAAVPFFFVTNNTKDIEVQIHVLRFIQKLLQLKDD